MNYIYDISLNLNKEYFSFYEWNTDDDIDFFLRIPIFKIEKDLFYEIINNNFTVEKRFLSIIKNKSELYSKEKNYTYICILSTDDYAFSVSFDKNGNSILKSSILIDDLDDIIEFSKLIKYTLIDIKIISNKQINFFTRDEEVINKELLGKLDSLYKSGNNNAIEYIFYEIYNERIDDINKAYFKLKNIIFGNSEKVKLLYSITKKIST